MLAFSFHCSDETHAIDQKRVVSDLAPQMRGYDLEEYFSLFSFRNYHHLLMAHAGCGSCQALLGTMFLPCSQGTCLVLVSGFVGDSLQGQGLMRRMIARTMAELRSRGCAPDFLAARTYNPIWYCMLRGLGTDLSHSAFYPAASSSGQDPQLAEIAREIVGDLNPDALFEPQSGVLRDGLARTPALFRSQRPFCGIKEIDDFFHGDLGAIDLVVTLLDLRRVSEANRASWLSQVMR